MLTQCMRDLGDGECNGERPAILVRIAKKLRLDQPYNPSGRNATEDNKLDMLRDSIQIRIYLPMTETMSISKPETLM